MRRLGFALLVALAAPAARADCPRGAPTSACDAFARGKKIMASIALGGVGWVDAQAAFREAIAGAPRWADAHEQLAEALLALDDEQDALVEYTEAVRLAPDRGGYYLALADLYERLSLLDHASRVLAAARTHVARTDPARFDLLLLDGKVRERKGDATGAVRRYERAKQTCGECTGLESPIFFALGMACARAEPPRKAEAASNLTMYVRIVCRGAAGSRFADECVMAIATLAALAR
jgi:tetratricopeptide (TPR) repeat protein